MVNKLKLLEKYSFLLLKSASNQGESKEVLDAGSPDLTVKDIESAKERLNNGYVISFGHEVDIGYLELIKEISLKLNEIGFAHSPTTVFNQDLSKSISDFQKENSLNITGQIDKELYLKLLKNKDIIVKKTKEEKRHDESRTGQFYAVMNFDKEKRNIRNEYFYEDEIEKDSDEKKDDSKNKDTYVPQGKFDVNVVSAESGVPAAMIMAFIAGESGGNSKAKAFNGDNYCSNLGWNESKVDQYHAELISGNVKGKIDTGSVWVLTDPKEILIKVESEKEFEEKYESKGMKYIEIGSKRRRKKKKKKGEATGGKGYAYHDIAYFSAHRKGDSQKAFDIAYKVDPTAAVKATAWGKGQVLGEHLINEYAEITNLGSGKEARDFFDRISEEASSKMYVSWVKAAGSFKNTRTNRKKAKLYGIPEVIGSSYIDVINMAVDNPDQVGYFAFLTAKYYGTFSRSYASKLKENYLKMEKIYSNKRITARIKRLKKIKQGF